jgi:rhamnogalacturonyl hydrolase YesR
MWGGDRTKRLTVSELSINEAGQLLDKLEKNPHLILAHWDTLEGLIADCMERVYRATDKQTKMQLAAIEYRARMLRERAKPGRN